MEYLYAPWRIAYFSKKPKECVFCHMAKEKKNDNENLVIFRDSLCFGVMNLYPYTPGHFMVIPYAHEDGIEKLDMEVWQQMSYQVQNGVRMLKEHFKVEGVNIGMNLGEIGGAGIAEHVHYHLVPRHKRDTNFITTIADMRVNGIDFAKIYRDIREVAPKYFIIKETV